MAMSDEERKAKQRERGRKYREMNREKVREIQRKHYAIHREYYAVNREKIREKLNKKTNALCKKINNETLKNATNNNQPWTIAEIKTLEILRSKNHTYREIAVILKRTHYSINNYLRRIKHNEKTNHSNTDVHNVNGAG